MSHNQNYRIGKNIRHSEINQADLFVPELCVRIKNLYGFVSKICWSMIY